MIPGAAPTRRASLAATAVAAITSGAPSTIHSVVSRRPLLATVQAAGALVPGHAVGRPGSPVRLADLVAGAAAHSAVSLFWGTVLGYVLPQGRRAAWGAVAGAGIHLLDLGLIARLPRLAPMRALPQAPQLADHVAFGFVVGLALDLLDPPAAPRTIEQPATTGQATSSSPLG